MAYQASPFGSSQVTSRAFPGSSTANYYSYSSQSYGRVRAIDHYRYGRLEPTEPLHADMTLAEILCLSDGMNQCFGYAATRNRRCWNSASSGLAWLAEGESRFRGGQSLSRFLQDLALACLCTRWHKDQAHTVKRFWEARVAEHRRLFPQGIAAAATLQLTTGSDRGRVSAQNVAVAVTVAAPTAPLAVPSGHIRSTSQPPTTVANTQRQVLRRPVNEDCTICYETVQDNTPVVWCKQQCGHNYHERCFLTWQTQCLADGRPVTCTYW